MIDQFILEFDKALRTVFAPAPTRRPMPGEDLPEAELSEAERRHAAALMRVRNMQRNNLASLVSMAREVEADPSADESSKRHQMRRRF